MKLEDFEERRNGAVWMTTQYRRKFLEAFEKRLLTEVKGKSAEAEAEPWTYREWLYRQAVQIRELARGRIAAYEPFTLRA